ncbi:hypothetical protein G4B88_015270 [Cannabis sativa]|uniref:Uncharacterized protein n=1 Tax=Cannabis sativa TaxID=3483 RepID=A0A7J6E4T2_CANSA|nr:hypothetical protein G4B88_015270 [Cannabis sativa]
MFLTICNYITQVLNVVKACPSLGLYVHSVNNLIFKNCI